MAEGQVKLLVHGLLVVDLSICWQTSGLGHRLVPGPNPVGYRRELTNRTRCKLFYYSFVKFSVCTSDKIEGLLQGFKEENVQENSPTK